MHSNRQIAALLSFLLACFQPKLLVEKCEKSEIVFSRMPTLAPQTHGDDRQWCNSIHLQCDALILPGSSLGMKKTLDLAHG